MRTGPTPGQAPRHTKPAPLACDAARLRAALAVARDNLVHAQDLDEATLAALRRWPVPEYGPPAAGYWRRDDLHSLLAGSQPP
jgi:hypothetical protein